MTDYAKFVAEMRNQGFWTKFEAIGAIVVHILTKLKGAIVKPWFLGHFRIIRLMIILREPSFLRVFVVPFLGLAPLGYVLREPVARSRVS